MAERYFSALLKYWRGRRALSQLDLALAADVSARHVSFLETGRASPSEEMVLRLASALDLPLREQNQLLAAAGFAPRFSEPPFDQVPPAVELAIERMMRQQEPFPLTVLSPGYDVLRSNAAARRIFARFVAEPEHLSPPVNLLSLVFDPRLARPFIPEWERVGRSVVARLHRESLRRQEDPRVGSLLDRVLGYPGVPVSWRQPDFSVPMEPTLVVRLARGSLSLAFLTTVTVFSAPQQVTLAELMIESYFPLDAETTRACERLAAEES